jgi:hypothetical protein
MLYSGIIYSITTLLILICADQQIIDPNIVAITGILVHVQNCKYHEFSMDVLPFKLVPFILADIMDN